MQRPLRFGLLLGLAIALSILLLSPVSSQQQSSSQSPETLSSLRLYPQEFIDAVNQGRLADAVLLLENGWKVQYDEYYRWLGESLTVDKLPADRISQELTRINKESALVYVISTVNRLDVILLLPNGQLIHKPQTGVSSDRLTATVEHLRDGFVKESTSPREYQQPAGELYRWIVQPLEQVLAQQGIKHLIFCLGGNLRSVPMAGLYDSNQNKFLIQKYSVSVIPAFNLLDRNPSVLRNTKVLAMGATSFQGQQAPLPAVRLEVGAIANLWQGVTFLDEDFTLRKLQQQRQRRDNSSFGIIHLATHAKFAGGRDSIQNSYIQFSDQKLELDQLREMQLRLPIVQLLVLSACETAVGDVRAGTGFAGLAVQSGAKAVVATLWKIGDSDTALAMTDFYKNLKDRSIKTKVEALRRTQLAMLNQELSFNQESIQSIIRNIRPPISASDRTRILESTSGNLSHPKYWAGLTMIGNPW